MRRPTWSSCRAPISPATSRLHSAPPLVVQALDGANKGVAGVPITWTVMGGGTVSPRRRAPPTRTEKRLSRGRYRRPPAYRLSPRPARSLRPAPPVSFVANNGATITGTITPAGGLPFGATFSRTPSRTARFGTAAVRGSTPCAEESHRRRVRRRRARRGGRRIESVFVDGGGAPNAVAHADQSLGACEILSAEPRRDLARDARHAFARRRHDAGRRSHAGAPQQPGRRLGGARRGDFDP